MPLQIQLGDLATRIARAFGVRGRIPMSLDEQIVPVSIVEYPADPPFCDVPQYWATSATASGDATNRGFVGVRVTSGVAVVDGVSATLITAAGSLALQLNRNQVTAFNATDQIFTLNLQTPVNAGAGFPRPSMRMVQDMDALVAGLQLWSVSSAINVPLDVPVPFGLCLYPGDELLLYCSNLAQQARVNMHGRWYPAL